MVTRRDKFHRVYDLTERVLPSHVNTNYPVDDELGRFQILRTIQAHGLVTKREILTHLKVAEDSIVTSP